MKTNTIGLWIGITLFILACGLTAPTPAQESTAGVETVVAATLESLTAAAPNPQPSGTQAEFQNVKFTIPENLATSAQSQIVPAADDSITGPWGVAPEHIEFVLVDYPVKDEFFPPVVRIYPAREYAEVNPWAQGSISRLQAILASPSMPLTNDNLSTIPFNGAAAQQYAAQAKRLSFLNGNGVAMLSQYAQFPGPILKNDSYYHFEGLTSDGKYLVAIMFPVTLPIQASADNPSADGIKYPDDRSDVNGLNTYFQEMTDFLNSADPASFQPDLNLLDTLVRSISIQ